jgi:hypothetical protein
MKRGIGLSLVAAALLLVPAVASASDQWRPYGGRARAEIRREIQRALRDSRRARFEMRRDLQRALARDRWALRQSLREARRDAQRARREARRAWWD